LIARPIQTLLIANRGEIACRIIRTARRLGIRTVAVYSSADALAMHVQLADQALCIGEPSPADSYLNIANILQAASDAGADAIHPGYGFLAENAEFATACATAGLTFVGPPVNAINMMGLKGAARQRMQDAGVPVLPGINALVGVPVETIEAIGYPVLIKPEAGGGGKGMKVVHNSEELAAAVSSAAREASSSFGNPSLMIEKYLLNPRHIEIQVFSDQAGNCVHLFERDCSLQRRHQKIIEESPAPAFSAALREAMGQAAVAAAEAIDYVGAGTIEFLLGEDQQFYFMEMNTRLQVEHPVTEAVTGVDLVEWQLLIAAGRPLPLSQVDITSQGHAMELRLYAEDPLNEFLPVAGRLDVFQLPPVGPHLRIDNGVQQGDLVGVYYDPMLLKLIAHGHDRGHCISTLVAALEQLHISGIRTNRDFLRALLRHDKFVTGAVATDYLDNHLERVFSPPTQTGIHAALCDVMAGLLSTVSDASPWRTAINFRQHETGHTQLTLHYLDSSIDSKTTRPMSIDISPAADGYRLAVEGDSYHCRPTGLFDNTYTLNGVSRRPVVYQQQNRFTVITPDRVFEFSRPDMELTLDNRLGTVQAPMTGKVVAVLVKVTDVVQAGDALVVIEAMKMEHTITAPAAGSIGAIHFKEADLVAEGLELLEFIPLDSPPKSQ
jgi:3-methylcrotonyl-CoA carboxylase alpha subunit